MKQVITHSILKSVSKAISLLSILLLLTASSFAQNNTPCNAQFQFYPGTNPDSVHFYASATGSTTLRYSWSFGDGTSGDGPSPWHFYSDSGAKTVCLTVSDSTQSGKCTTTQCDTVHISGTPPPPPPTCSAEFTHYPSQTNPDSVHFYPTGGTNTAKIAYSWDFGDRTYSSAFNPWHVYAPGSYYVCLTIEDTISSTLICTNTWCDSVHVVPTNPVQCNANFTFRNDSVNALYTISYFSNQNPPGTKYYWSFGDGITSSDPDPTHAYAHGGTYWVCLYVSDSGICHSSTCDSVHVQDLIKPTCNAEFQFYSLSGNADSVHFYASSTNTTTHYVWSFGDGQYSTSPNPWHFYANGGAHNVCLTVSDSTSGGKCTSTWCDSVHIAPPPPPCNAHFTTIRPGTVANYVYFVSAANPSGTNYSWNFGDNTPVSTAQNPTHTFANDGTYQVCLTVTNTAIPCSETWCDSITIKTQPRPTCNAQFVHYSLTSNADSVHFYITPANVTSTSYSWTFGDGGTSTNSDPWHLYAHPGAYQVCLTVTNTTQGGVCTATWCDSIHIAGPTPPLCNAHFQDYYATSNPDSVHFYSSTAASPATIYSWSFGDGTGSNDRYPWHYYADTGTYNVCLTVTDSTAGGKCTDTQCNSIHIAGPTPPRCNAHFTHIASTSLNTTIHFIPATNIPGTTYTWAFGDGDSSSNVDPNHMYANSGAYDVCLTVTNSTIGGVCTDTWCDSVHIGITGTPCNAHFNFTYANTINTLYFVHDPNAPDTKYSWDFGDGSTSGDPNALHTFANPGSFWVCLTVWDSLSTCRATWCDSVHVGGTILQICNSNFYFKPGNVPHSLYFFSEPNPPGTQYFWDFGDGYSASLADAFHQYAAAGTYKVCLTVTDTVAGCSDTRCLTINPLRMAEGGSTMDVPNSGDVVASIYPNPLTDNATLHIENASGVVAFSMYDNLGRLVRTVTNLSNGDYNLSKDGLGAGIYFYQVIDGNNNVTRGKLLIQ